SDFDGVGGGNLSGPTRGSTGDTGGSAGGNSNGVGYNAPNGVPVSPKPKPTLQPLPLIPDVSHPQPQPTPIDETILAASPQAPQRKPLQNSALGGSFPSQAGITG